MLYLVAAYTGFRASELAAFKPEQFHLEASPPRVDPLPRETKEKRDEPIPLPHHVATQLRTWLKGKPAGKRLWPGRWAELKKQVHWLERDLKRGGVSKLDAQGRKATFHGLRRRYITRVIDQAGGNFEQVMRLARQKDLKTTMEYYVHSELPDLGHVVDRLLELPKVG